MNTEPCINIYNLLKHFIHYCNENKLVFKHLFFKNEFFIACSLGGKNCNIQHIVDITIPMITKTTDYRTKSPKNYKARLKNSISKDLKVLNPKRASFYALFIFSNINKEKNFKN